MTDYDFDGLGLAWRPIETQQAADRVDWACAASECGAWSILWPVGAPEDAIAYFGPDGEPTDDPRILFAARVFAANREPLAP